MRASNGAAGFDLYSSSDCTVAGMSRQIVDTDLAIELPRNTQGLIAGRSGLAFKHNLIAFNGIIDEDYRGPISIYLMNFSNQDYCIKVGDRIAQLIVQPVLHPDVVESLSLTVTERNGQGFGSTGK